LDPQTVETEVAELLARVRANGVGHDPGASRRLTKYCLALSDWGQAVNLVSRREIPQLVSKHIGPSLGVLLIAEPSQHEYWIDVGTGAGFPGAVVKLCRPDVRMTLLDSVRKKTLFLDDVRVRLEMPDLRVIHGRVEDPGLMATAGSRERYDVILMRAVAPLERSLELIDGIAGRGARLVTFKGPRWEEEVARASESMHRLGWGVECVAEIPWSVGRVLKLVRGGARP
jgi:16S rRNA (guanine527-N7)-methyltransferase